MQRFLTALFLGLSLCVMTSCSWFLGSYDGPVILTHGYVQGVTPGNATIYNDRTYPTVQANWPGPGGDNIWLAVNLGATTSPKNSVDESPASAGWYFQFNRKQAYYHNGTTLTPSWRTNNVNEDSEWEPENDPCRILLEGNWRLPTVEELRAFLSAPVSRGGMGEGNRTSAFNSKLNMHAAGKLHSYDGRLEDRGSNGNYWASNQFSNTRGEILGFGQGNGSTFSGNKTFARSVRCIRD